MNSLNHVKPGGVQMRCAPVFRIVHCCAITCLVLWFVVGTQSLGADSCRVVSVFVAMADNEHQGIIPVSQKLGNGSDLDNNLYWGAAYGVKTYFLRSPDWKLVSAERQVRPDTVLEQCVFKHVRLPLRVIAHAYKGERIREAIADFLVCVAKRVGPDATSLVDTAEGLADDCTNPDLVAYIGHDGLMDFNLPVDSLGGDSTGRPAIILACMSRQFFGKHIAALRSHPVIWTTGLMAPEAYTLEAAIVSWAKAENEDEIRSRAAEAYDRFQHCGVKAAKRLLVTGF